MAVYDDVRALCAAAAAAAPSMARASTKSKNEALTVLSALLGERSGDIISANKADLDAAEENGVPVQMRDRLMLNEARINGIRESLGELVALTDPVGSGECWTRPSGIRISCVRVPLGVIGIIYEARPNVTVDAAALCLKTGNAAVLRGGKEAVNTNRLLAEVMKQAMEKAGLDSDALGLITDTTHDSSNALMRMTEYVDVLIPRGSRRLIDAVSANSTVPVIKTGAGNCHLYIDASADAETAVRIAVNAKCQRPAVCNSIETLLVHESRALELLPAIAEAMAPWGVQFRCCERTARYISGAVAATEEDWETEYDDYILAVKQVASLDEAIAHINKYNTKHSESIITRSLENATRFKNEIDAAAVYVNASTRFTDGGEFGFGAEIGISTQKLHARGPMGLEALTTQKYLIDGNGEIR